MWDARGDDNRDVDVIMCSLGWLDWLADILSLFFSLRERERESERLRGWGRYLVHRRCVLCSLPLCQSPGMLNVTNLDDAFVNLFSFCSRYTLTHTLFARRFSLFFLSLLSFISLRRAPLSLSSMNCHCRQCFPFVFSTCRCMFTHSPVLFVHFFYAGFGCCRCSWWWRFSFLFVIFHLSRELKNNGTHERNVVVSSNRLIINNKSA